MSMFDIPSLTIGGTKPNAVPVVKPLGDARAGVWEFVHNAKSGHMFHLLAGPTFGGSACVIAIGHDADDGTGTALLLAEKSNGRGMVIDQRSTKTLATAYGFYGTNASTAAPLMRLEQVVTGAAAALQVVAGGTPAAGQILAQFNNHLGSIGRIEADTGKLVWLRGLEMRDPNGSTVARLSARSDEGVAAPTVTHFDKSGFEFRTWAGSNAIYYPKRIAHIGTQLRFEGAANTNGLDTAPASWVTGLALEFNTGTARIGFLGATPVIRQAALTAADATAVDATYGAEEAAVITNMRTRLGELETKLKAYGLLA